MPLREDFEKTGNMLFRYRSYFPLLLVPLILGTVAARPVAPSPLEEFWDKICLILSSVGLVLRALTVGYVPKGTSGRNTKRQKAEHLNSTGMYSIVRHPLYLANFLVWLGMVLFSKSFWCVLVSILGFWLYYERIMYAEEEFVREKYGEEYLRWAEKVPAFIPRIGNWRTPRMAFSFKSVLAREYTTIFVTVAYFSLMDTLENLFQTGKVDMDLFWKNLLIAATAFYVLIRLLKKKTRLLKVEGR